LPKITILGYGGWVSDPLFGQSGFILHTDTGKTILIDAGEGTWYWLGSCGLNSFPDTVLLTHGHGDHVLGVPTLVMWASYAGRKLRVLGHDTAIKAVKGILRATYVENTLDDVVETETLEEGEWVRVAEDAEVMAVSAIHPVPAYSYVLLIGKRKVAYSGDTRPNPEFIREARGADVLIHEVGVPSGQEELAKKFGHTSETEICDVIREISPKLFIPYHYFLKEASITCETGVRILRPRHCLSVDLGH
jgi:ribonuclease Z